MAYIGQEPGLGEAEYWIFTASGSETSITQSSAGIPINYTVGHVSVYLNGVKLIAGTDFVASDGSTISSLAALAASDVVEVVALSTFSPADTVPATGGTFTGSVFFNGDHIKVPVHANDSARNTAIGSPANGMLIYNTDAGALQQYNGVWSTVAPAPNISSVSGFLNADTDSTITVFGTNFNSSSAVKMFDASSGGSQVGSNATTTFNLNTKLTAVFGAGSIPVAGNTVYIEVDNSGATNRFSSAITVNADPIVTFTGGTGTGFLSPSHLGTYGGLSAGGPADSDTTMLLNFDRGGGTDFEDSSNTGSTGHLIESSGGAIIKASPYGDGKSAMFFDGSDDKLTIPVHADFAFGTGDFTIECWAFFDTVASFQIICSGRSGSSEYIIIDYKSADDDWRVHLGSALATFEKVVIAKKWYHVAVTRSGTDLRFFLDGKQLGSTITNSSQVSSDTNPFTIGSDPIDNRWWDGYIDEFRVVKGAAAYTSNFTPRTTRIDSSAEAATTKLLISGGKTPAEVTSDNTFNTTASTSNDYGYQIGPGTLTVTGSIHSIGGSGIAPAIAWPANGKTFGSAGAYFDGTGDFIYINADSDDWNFAAGEFTIDAWIWLDAPGTGEDCIIGVGDSGGNTTCFRFDVANSTSKLRFNIAPGNVMATSSASIAAQTWTHIAAVRDNTGTDTIRMFINGVADGTSDVNGVTLTNSTNDLAIGRFGEYDGSYVTGYIDGLRISKGVARWTEDFDEDLPTSIYGAIGSSVIPTITFTGATTTQLAADEDVEFTSIVNPTLPATTQHLTDTGIGLTLTNLTGGDKDKATLTGTVGLAEDTSRNGMAVKAQVRKSLGDAAYNNSTAVTFSGSTVTTGLAPGMPVTGSGISIAGPLTCGLTDTDATVTAASTTGLVVGMQVNAFTGVPAGATILSIITNTSFELSANATATDSDAILTFNTIIASVDSSTTLTLSNVTTGGSLSSQTLIFEDLTRVAHVNGPDVLDGTQAMMTIATGEGGAPVLFNARRYKGSGAARSITGYGFKPDLVWIKRRDDGYGHHMYNSLLGPGINLRPDVGEAQVAYDSTSHTSFDADGWGMDTGSNIQVNGAAQTHIAWGWKAGGAPTATNAGGQTPTAGSVLVNGVVPTGTELGGTSGNYPTSNIYPTKQTINTAGGFSITQYAGSGSQSTVPHGLGAAPDFVMVKAINSTGNWVTWHKDLTADTILWLDTDAAENGTAHRHEVSGDDHVELNNGDANINSASFNYLIYAWKAVAGVSAFGVYTGNALTSGPIQDCGFIPRMVIIKSNSAASRAWLMYDVFRSGADSNGDSMLPLVAADVASAETSANNDIEIYDSGGTQGFRPVTAGDAASNSSGTYIWAAFA